MKTRNSDNTTQSSSKTNNTKTDSSTQSSSRVDNTINSNAIHDEEIAILRTDRPPEGDVTFITELITEAQSHFIHLLTQRQKRQNAIAYHTNALAQGILPNNIRLELKPYSWPASFDVEENRENHRKEVKILNTALKEIANNRLNILKISLDQIKEEININNEENFILDEIIKTRPITDKFMTYYKSLDTQYNSFTNDNITTTVHISNQTTEEDSDSENSQNNNTNNTNNNNNNYDNIKNNNNNADNTNTIVDLASNSNKKNKKKKNNTNLQNNSETIITDSNSIVIAKPNDNNIDTRLNTIVTVIENLANVISNNNNNNNYKRNNQNYNNNNYYNNNKQRYNNNKNSNDNYSNGYYNQSNNNNNYDNNNNRNNNANNNNNYSPRFHLDIIYLDLSPSNISPKACIILCISSSLLFSFILSVSPPIFKFSK